VVWSRVPTSSSSSTISISTLCWMMLRLMFAVAVCTFVSVVPIIGGTATIAMAPVIGNEVQDRYNTTPTHDLAVCSLVVVVVVVVVVLLLLLSFHIAVALYFCSH